MQCLGKQPDINSIIAPIDQAPSPYGVCWCADKKGAPLKGSLTRDHEPTCNSRQGRNFNNFNSSDILMEQLIRQMTILTDVDNYLEEIENDVTAEARSLVPELEVEAKPEQQMAETVSSVTERILELANSLWDSQLVVDSVKPMNIKSTRCRSLANTAPFPVSCDENGAFLPTQCNKKHCWCVDSAGNQLESSPMFEPGSYTCPQTEISLVVVELLLQNITTKSIRNISQVIRRELQQMLSHDVDNLVVQKNEDGSLMVRFELQGIDKIDMAFAIESAISNGDFLLGEGHYKSDITRSLFIHRRLEEQPDATFAKVTSHAHEGTIQMVLFITASSTALLICIFVVYFMMKRGSEKTNLGPYNGYPPPYSSRKNSLSNEADFAAPIFVLSPEHDLESIRPQLVPKSQEKC